jgi:hypothetical protein
VLVLVLSVLPTLHVMPVPALMPALVLVLAALPTLHAMPVPALVPVARPTVSVLVLVLVSVHASPPHPFHRLSSFHLFPSRCLCPFRRLSPFHLSPSRCLCPWIQGELAF